MKVSRSLQLNATVSSIVLAAALAFGASMLTSAPAAADETMTQAHTQMPGVADIVRDPTDLPPPIGVRQPVHVPGPFVRVRVGDTA